MTCDKPALADVLAQCDPSAPHAGEVWADAQPVGREFGAPAGNALKPSEALALRRADVLRILAAAGVRNPRVFGSVARGEDTEGSDLDLWIDAPAGLTLFDLGGLAHDLQTLLGVPVDIDTGFRTPQIADAAARDARPL
ncbi:nucleotidyltransferase family protein [Paraburkholderia caledonica]|uniref:nucleotidyltransferase family protein n=1 Tax=Paraburkholderia caledonica TaxID=134536 RepID=UPI001C4F0618|nr:nucleotidyltransferase domain-containing protein [Paraburkholderia caledonica]